MSGAEGTTDTRPAPPIPPAEQFVADSPLEEDEFELLVPPSKRTAVRRTRLFVFWRPAAPAAIVFISENEDFELPASQSNLARRAR